MILKSAIVRLLGNKTTYRVIAATSIAVFLGLSQEVVYAERNTTVHEITEEDISQQDSAIYESVETESAEQEPSEDPFSRREAMEQEIREYESNNENVDSAYYNATVKEVDELSNEYAAFDTSGLLRISDKCYFDEQSKLFYISVPGYQQDAIVSNVMDGMYVQGEVSISTAPGLRYKLVKDGEELTSYDGEPLIETGSYSLMVETNQSNGYAALQFNILGEYTNETQLTLPSNFYITSVTMDGDDMRRSASFIEFPAEGQYEVTYEIVGLEEEFKLKLNLDTTAPTLALKELNERNQANGDVDISDLEEDCDIYITLDGESIPYKKVLTVPGEYQIVVEDKAGNQSSYSFSILFHVNLNSVLFILLFITVIAGVTGYMIYIRKHLRVR